MSHGFGDFDEDEDYDYYAQYGDDEGEDDREFESTDEEDEYKVDKHSYRRPALPQRSTYQTDGAREDAKVLARVTKRFNTWATFLGGESESSRPWQRGEKALRLMEEMEDLLKQLARKTEELDDEVTIFTDRTATFAKPYWYKDVEDLTDVDPLELELAFLPQTARTRESGWTDDVATMDIPNLKEYAKHLETMLPRAAKRRDARHVGQKFFRNIDTLIRKLSHQRYTSGKHQDLRLCLWVLVKTQVLRGDCPRIKGCKFREFEEFRATVDSEIESLLDFNPTPRLAIDFWNYAVAFRHLYGVWHTPQIDEVLHIDYNSEWQRASVALLQTLHGRATKEIRASTALALRGVPQQLSPEVQELIFEATMEAEHVPLKLTDELAGIEHDVQ